MLAPDGTPLANLHGRYNRRVVSLDTFGMEGATGDWATRAGVRNFGGASYDRVGGREALVRNINTAFADLGMRVGPSVLDRHG